MTDVIRAEWYDVEEAEEAEFLSRLHSEFLPRVRSLAGVAWVGHYRIAPKAANGTTDAPTRHETSDPTVPKGSQFVLLTAAANLDLLLLPSSGVAQMERDAAPLLACRKAYRDAVFLEEECVPGPKFDAAGGAEAPPAMQIGNFNVLSPSDERELARYYRLHRFLQVRATPGCIKARKLVSVAGWPKHGILYEFTAIEPDEVLFEARFNNALPALKWAGRHVLSYVVHGPNAPHAGRRIWPELQSIGSMTITELTG